MATIYRFIVENQTKASGEGGAKNNARATKGAAKKGKSLALLSGSKGGVEHNRKMRAINPILNKLTYGVWEKGTRLSRAASGIIKVNPDTGKITGISGPAIAIIIAFILLTTWNQLAKWNVREIEKAEKLNTQNYKMLESGGAAIRGSYRISVNTWSGRMTYNENK